MQTKTSTGPNSETEINRFQGEYRWLSNFHPCPIQYESLWFPSVEHAYQAAKTEDLRIRRHIQVMGTGEAKNYGRGSFVISADWSGCKLAVMRRLLDHKFEYESLRDLLIATGPKVLREGNAWGDQFWGCTWGFELWQWEGENHLGNLLMEVRSELVERAMLQKAMAAE